MNDTSKKRGLRVGDKVRCNESMYDWWTEGKIYEVVEIDSYGCAIVCDDDGCHNWPGPSPSRFEVVNKYEMETKVSNMLNLEAGDKVKCTESIDYWWTMGKLYQVTGIDINGYAVVVNDNGESMWPELSASSFEPARSDEEVDDRVSDLWGLKVGDKVRCNESIDGWFTEGKLYEVAEINSCGHAAVYNDNGDGWNPEYCCGRFSPVPHEFSIYWGLRVGDKLRCIENIGSWLTKGKIYEVFKIESYIGAIIYDDEGNGYAPETSFLSFEVVKEDKEVDSHDGKVYVDTSGMGDEELERVDFAKAAIQEGAWLDKEGREVSLQELESIAFRNLSESVRKRVDEKVKDARLCMMHREFESIMYSS